MTTKSILLILDGWGIGKPYPGNAIHLAHKPNFDKLLHSYPSSTLKTSGEYVGLPEGQMGNSEVGHLNIGAGRIVFQQLVRINKAFKEQAVARNKTLLDAIAYAQSSGKHIHLIGLVSDGGVHSSLNHLEGLCELLYLKGCSSYSLHAFTDGRDTDPKSGVQYLKRIESVLHRTHGTLASVIGRYYAMDRDKRWERIKLAYDLLVSGSGEKTSNLIQSLETKYELGETDEFIKPVCKVDEQGMPVSTIRDGDVVICFNFRTDRARELTQALTQIDMPQHGMKKMELHYITLTEYDKTFENIGVVFPDIELNNTMGEVLERYGKKQVRIAETEKYPHVTYFFSGGREKPFVGETRYMAPSPKVATYDLQPEMSAEEVCTYTLNEIEKSDADFICVNFANPDMVGHTGVVQAEIKAIEKVDECLGRIVDAALAKHYTILITADHGNGEYMINELDDSPNTAHTTNNVPCILVAPHVAYTIRDGCLADIAPTLLTLMNIPVPAEMTGEVLLK